MSPGFRVRHQLGFHICLEELTIDRAIDYPWSRQSVVAQGGDKSLGIPMSKRAMIDQTFTNRCPAAGFYHFCIE